MHSIGFEPMTSPFTLLLQGVEVPFELELNGYLPKSFEFRSISLSIEQKIISIRNAIRHHIN
jgi:hypothetical protein